MMLLASIVPMLTLTLGQVELRGDRPTPTGDVTEVSKDGVLVGGHLHRWDEVRRVEGDFADEASPWIEAIATTAWRARTRLERGDAVGAEPLFEELARRYRDDSGEMSALVHEGLMRCRLRRGTHVGAIAPWLTLVDRGGASPFDTLPDVIDPSGLAPSLPPIWLKSPSLDMLIRDDAVGTSTRSEELAAWYRHGARFEMGFGDDVPGPIPNDATAAFVAHIVRARTGDESQRLASRRALQQMLAAEMPTWREAWIRVAIGRSLLLEEDDESRRLGVVQLLHVPARMGKEQPHLAGIALAEGAVALQELGDVDGAGVLRSELLGRYPGHPALDWAPIRAWTRTTPPASTKTERNA